MKTNHKIVEKPREAINIILWIMDAKKKGYIKRDYLDFSGVWYPITLERLLWDVVNKGQFAIELKKESFLGEPGDITILEFK